MVHTPQLFLNQQNKEDEEIKEEKQNINIGGAEAVAEFLFASTAAQLDTGLFM